MNDLYTVWTTVGGYRVVKFDFLLNVQAVYFVRGSLLTRFQCQCHRKDKFTCRHRQLISLFASLDRINQGYFYCWDTPKWHLPVTEEYNRVRKRLAR